MRHYEIVFLVHPDQSEQVPAMINRHETMVKESGGTVHRVEDWGRRQLAYLIKEVHKAHYVMMNIECSLDTLNEIETNFQFNDAVLRHLVVKRKKAPTAASPLAKEEAAPKVEEKPVAKAETVPAETTEETPAAETAVEETPVAETAAEATPATEEA